MLTRLRRSALLRPAAVTLVALAWTSLAFCNGSFEGGTDVDTKGRPLEGGIGNVGRIRFFGEGTTKIHFDSEQHLQLWDKDGNTIAGFEAEAIDPKKAKITQAYEYWFQVNGKRKGVGLEHQVSKASYKNGKMTLTNPIAQVLTSYKIRGKKVTVIFKSITQSAGPPLVNILTLLSGDRKEEFRFNLLPSSSMIGRISDNGEFGRFLIGQGPQEGSGGITRSPPSAVPPP
jgi:hypothetical protein